jgi:hypothetical protein
MEKLRKEFAKERKMMENIHKVMKDEPTEKTCVKKARPPIISVTPTSTKMVVDPRKLEETIKKACIPVMKRSIQILDKLPSKPEEHVKPKPTAVVVCKAMNLNGTPCKCRAKVGKFCAKHAS